MDKVFEHLPFFGKNRANMAKIKTECEIEQVINTISVFIQYNKTQQIEIKIPQNLQDSLTCGWLLEETIKKMTKVLDESPKPDEATGIATLRTKNCDFAVDFLLNDEKRSLNFLKDKTILEPYYGHNLRSTDEFESKLGLDDFEIETKLGYGAFSNVYLGNLKADSFKNIIIP